MFGASRPGFDEASNMGLRIRDEFGLALEIRAVASRDSILRYIGFMDTHSAIDM